MMDRLGGYLVDCNSDQSSPILVFPDNQPTPETPMDGQTEIRMNFSGVNPGRYTFVFDRIGALAFKHVPFSQSIQVQSSRHILDEIQVTLPLNLVPIRVTLLGDEKTWRFYSNRPPFIELYNFQSGKEGPRKVNMRAPLSKKVGDAPLTLETALPMLTDGIYHVNLTYHLFGKRERESKKLVEIKNGKLIGESINFSHADGKKTPD
ncbi:hypothetical protein [Phragmitibacter flavus]|nr:hypothetical protein [Phragmitibacter flavus]